jgi:hypothetical protein
MPLEQALFNAVQIGHIALERPVFVAGFVRAKTQTKPAYLRVEYFQE